MLSVRDAQIAVISPLVRGCGKLKAEARLNFFVSSFEIYNGVYGVQSFDAPPSLSLRLSHQWGFLVFFLHPLFFFVPITDVMKRFGAQGSVAHSVPFCSFYTSLRPTKDALEVCFKILHVFFLVFLVAE